MKKNGLLVIFFSLAFMFSIINVRAESSVFSTTKTAATSASNFSNYGENLFLNGLQRRYTLKITNSSRFDIDEVYISSAEEDDWGEDMLDTDILSTNQYFTIYNIVPGEYDIKFVEGDGDECTLRNIAIFKNTAWIITTKWLEKCEGYR